MLEELCSLTFVQRQTAGITWIEILKSKALAFGDTEWMNKLPYTIKIFIFGHVEFPSSNAHCARSNLHDPLRAAASSLRRGIILRVMFCSRLTPCWTMRRRERRSQNCPPRVPQGLPAATNRARRTTCNETKQMKPVLSARVE